MSPGSNTILSLILIALGGLGITLSFMVPDRKKSLISLGIGAAIILVGAFQWGSQSIARFQMSRQMRAFQRERLDFEAVRQKMKEKAEATPVGPAAAPKKP